MDSLGLEDMSSGDQSTVHKELLNFDTIWKVGMKPFALAIEQRRKFVMAWILWTGMVDDFNAIIQNQIDAEVCAKGMEIYIPHKKIQENAETKK